MAGAAHAARAGATDGMRAAARAACAAAGREPPPWLEEAPLLHEDVQTGVTVPALGPEVRGDLERLARRLRPQIFRTHLYGHLVEHFVSRHGRGGTCRDVLGFLSSFLDRPDATALLTDSARRDQRRRRLVGDPRAAAPAPAAPRLVDLDAGPAPAATVLFQLAAPSGAALARGGHTLVVNQLQKGVGGMVARFLPLLGDRTALPAELRRWVARHCAGALPLEIPVASDWSGLQQPTGLFRRLRWPGEVPAGDDEQALALADLVLAHDPASSFLLLHDRGGGRLAPVYLGTAPAYLTFGPLRLLLTLADPWILPGAATPSPLDPPAAPAAAVEHDHRVVDGRLVLRRSRWRVPVEEFPRPLPAEPPVETLERADAWRRRWGVPLEVFVTAERRHVPVDPGRRKPLWLSFASVHSLRQAAALLDEDVVAVGLTEALPGRGDAWLRDLAGRSRASEFLALLGWPEEAR